MTDEIHEPTIARVRRDVEKYKCQAAWLDTWSLLRQFDRLRAENSALREAAREFVAEWDDLMRGQDATIDGNPHPDPRIEDRWTSGIKWRADVWARFVSRRDALAAVARSSEPIPAPTAPPEEEP